MLYHVTEAERAHTNRVNKKIRNRRKYPTAGYEKESINKVLYIF